MKEKLPLSEAVGSRLVGYIEDKDAILLVFEQGYALAEAYLDDGCASVDATSDISFDDYQAGDLVACGFGTAGEIGELFAGMRARRKINANKERLVYAAQAMKTLAENDPEAARKLITEAAEKYAVKP